MPATNAQIQYGKIENLHHEQNPHHYQKTLLFNDQGLIDVYEFDFIDQKLKHTDPVSEGGTTHSEETDFNMINNAIILYFISQKEGKIVAQNGFNEDAVIDTIKKYISPRISNLNEVAKEIYQSWRTLQLKTNFIRNVTEGSVIVDVSRSVRSVLQPLKEIPNFDGFLKGLINCYLKTVANDQNIQAWSLQQSLQLFLSTRAGHAFNQKRAETLIKAANVIEQNKKVVVENHKSSPQKEKEVAKRLNDLQEMLMKEAGMWLGTLKSLIEGDIANAFEDLKQNEIENFKSSLNNLLAGKYDKCSDIPAISEVFELIKGYLTADENSQFYKSTVNRDGANKPSLELFRAGIRLAIRRAANEHKIELNAEPILSGEIAQAPAAVPAAAGISSVVLSPVASQPAIVSQQLVHQSVAFLQEKDRQELFKQLQELFNQQIEHGRTAKVIYFNYNSDNCADFSDFGSACLQNGGPGYQLVYQYHDKDGMKIGCHFYPANKYQKLSALLDRIHIDYALFQMKNKSFAQTYDIFLDDYDLKNKEISFFVQENKPTDKPIRAHLNFVWDEKDCVFNCDVFQQRRHASMSSYGIYHPCPSTIKFANIKQYDVNDFITQFNEVLSQYGLTIDSPHIFLHGLFKIADFDLTRNETATICRTDNYLFIKFNIFCQKVAELSSKFYKIYGDYSTIVFKDEYTENVNPLHREAYYRIYYRDLIERILPEWKKAVVKLLSSQSALKGYQCLANNRTGIPTFVQIGHRYREIGAQHKLDNVKSNFIVATLLKWVNLYTNTIELAPINVDEANNISSVVCVDIYLPLSLEDVKKFIAGLNQLIPSAAAELINENIAYPYKPGMFRQISIDREAFMGPIADKIAATLMELQTKEPQFIETYQKQSGTYVEPSVGAALVLKSAALGNSPAPAAASKNPSSFWAQSTIVTKADTSDLHLSEHEIQNAITLITGKLTSSLKKDIMVFSKDNDNLQIVYSDNNHASYNSSLQLLRDKGLTVNLVTGEEFGVPYVLNIKHSVAFVVQKLDIDLKILRRMVGTYIEEPTYML